VVTLGSEQALKPQFDREAAVASIVYIADRLDRKDFHRIFKILYLAEKDHLERYGRTVVGDQFNAMTYGPVPFTVYNSLCAIRGDDKYPVMDEELHSELSRSVDVRWNRYIHPKVKPDLDSLSKSDIECLDRAIEQLSSKSFSHNTDISHDEAYERARKRMKNGPIHLDDILESLENGDLLREHLRNPYPGE
jgi:uncharacterized phage-associated protein